MSTYNIQTIDLIFIVILVGGYIVFWYLIFIL